jgi:hypothetical protein
MASYNWNEGGLLTLTPGDTATCTGGLNQQQLYGLFFYNSAQNDTGAKITVIWSNSQPPVAVQVPGTTANQGLASVLFVSGNDTNTISAAMTQNQPGAQVQCFIASVKMPINTTGIKNLPLEADGKMYPFNAFTRYFAVPESHWYEGQIQSDINQFISVQFTQQTAQVNIVNSASDPSSVIKYAGPTAPGQVTTNASKYQSLSWYLQGNGGQTVWVNADSVQNSESATISLQSLSAMYKAFKR